VAVVVQFGVSHERIFNKETRKAGIKDRFSCVPGFLIYSFRSVSAPCGGKGVESEKVGKWEGEKGGKGERGKGRWGEGETLNVER
jgi:hypothetical protein